MSEYGDFEREQRKLEMEYEGQDMNSGGFEQFIGWVITSVLVMLAGACGVLVFNWIEHFFRH